MTHPAKPVPPQPAAVAAGDATALSPAGAPHHDSAAAAFALLQRQPELMARASRLAAKHVRGAV